MRLITIVKKIDSLLSKMISRLFEASSINAVHSQEALMKKGAAFIKRILWIIAAGFIVSTATAADLEKITIDEHIKALGVYNATVKIAPEVSANLKIWVVKQQ